MSKTPVKTAGKAASTPAPAAAAKVSATAGSKPQARTPAPQPAPKSATATGTAPKSNARKTSTPSTPAAAPAPTHTFADRFGPARAAARTLPEPMNIVKPAVKADPKLANAWKTKSGRDLTEAELLAMPEAEYMNEQQIDFFRVRLQAQKDDLLSNAGETTEHLREDTTIVPDPADRATIEEEHALELRTRDRERKLLKKISQALNLLETGEYGFCDETGEPIGLPRLLARPTATLSLEAQQRRELKQKMFGD
ncbi:MAG: RNA polymerase-binding protein DksA [Rubrivivax sp.]|nr:RNA polymerase-binding protein DksA [Rubrivivax sp.]